MIKVTIFNEFRHEKQKESIRAIYPNGIHGAIKAGIEDEEILVRTVTLDDPECGLTQEVLDLRDNSGFPGMKVLGFAFDSREPSEYLPYQFDFNCVCYTGTHDNMTTRQWFETASEDAVAYAKEYMTLSEEEGLVWGVIRTAMASPANLCVILMQETDMADTEKQIQVEG